MVRPRSSSLAKNAESHSEAPVDQLREVHTKEGEAVNLTVSHGGVPLDSLFCA